jgi:hypothetical protein
MNVAYAKRLIAFLCFIVAAPAFAVYINGELKRARMENLASDPTSLGKGHVYFDTTNNVAKVHNGTSWVTLADTSATLSNPMDSHGDMIYRDGSGVQKLDSGSDGQLLMANGAAAPTWVNTITGSKTFSGEVTFSDDVTFGTEKLWTAAISVATTCSSSPCTSSLEYGGNPYGTITRASTGSYTVNFTASFWSAAPTCIAGSIRSGQNHNCQIWGAASTSSVAVGCMLAADGTVVDSQFAVTCTGTRN